MNVAFIYAIDKIKNLIMCFCGSVYNLCISNNISHNLMDYNWYELSYQGTKFKYKTDSFCDSPMGKRFSRLNHEYMLMTVASYGGPIALTSDKTQILTVREDDPSLSNICIYTNEGEIMQLVELVTPFKNIIVHLEFLQDEMLLGIFQEGQIWLVDPHTGKVNRISISGLLETELIK